MKRWFCMGSVISGCLLLAVAVADDRVVHGFVFHDAGGDGVFGADDPGIAGVLVSNGREVVVTDSNGRYELPLRADMDLTVVQPAGWRVPTDANQVPQFFHVYKQGGTPEPLRFGGLPDPGPPPRRIDFPLRPADHGDAFRCAVVGDPQTYSNDEVSHFRNSSVLDLIDEAPDCMIYLGDVVGDDLDLLDRLLELGAAADAPQWLIFGNHDMDFDASHPDHSADSWRHRAMPPWYAFEMGQVTFIALNNLVYPCGQIDAARPGREFCLQDPPRYNGRVSDIQMEWLANLLEQVPRERLIVLLHHVPLVSFSDADRPQHLTDNAAEIHALLAGRPALSLAGHTHTLENHDAGQWFAGWREHVDVGPLPFRHIIAGAASGGWWLGDLDIEGIPMALQRMGAPKGLLMLDFNATDYRERYRAARMDPARGQWVSFNTPAFRGWYQALAEWMDQPAEDRDPVPPVSAHDLDDLHLVTPIDLADGVYLSVNVWLGSAATRVRARIGDGDWMELARTQAGSGELPMRGAMHVDPKALSRQATSSRRAVVSRSGDDRAQGHEAFRGRRFQGVPAPQDRRMPDRNMHLWQLRLPADLPIGIYRVEVVSTDRHGQALRDLAMLEVREQRPPRRWRH